MSNLVLVLILLAVVGLAFQLGMRSGRGHHLNGVRMHSRPVYHGALVALWCAVPAFIVLSAWTLFERPLVESLALANVPDAAVATEQLRLVLLRRIEALASGFGVTGHVAAYEVAAAERLSQLRGIAGLAKVVVVLALAIIGLLFARSRLKPQLRARNQVEAIERGRHAGIEKPLPVLAEILVGRATLERLGQHQAAFLEGFADGGVSGRGSAVRAFAVEQFAIGAVRLLDREPRETQLHERTFIDEPLQTARFRALSQLDWHEPAERLLCSSLACAILDHSLLGHSGRRQDLQVKGGLAAHQRKDLLDYIEQHLDQPLSIIRLCS